MTSDAKLPIPNHLRAPTKGLHGKYSIERADGKALPDTFEAFVLRLDSGAEPNHLKACRAAILTYANEIEAHLPELAKDIRDKGGRNDFRQRAIS